MVAGTYSIQLKALAEFELSLSGFKQVESIAKKINHQDEYIKQLELLVEVANLRLRQGAIDNPVGLMIHIMKDKQSLFEEGFSPEIEESTTLTEVIPDWFKDRNKPKKEVEKTPEELVQLEKERQEMEAVLAKFRNRE